MSPGSRLAQYTLTRIDNFWFFMSLSAKVFRGSVLNAADLILRMGVMFFMTPFMVGHLGMVGFGTWVLLLSAISLLDLLDGGITLSGTRFLARTIGQGDSHAYAELVGTLAWLYHRIGWLCCIFTAALILSASVIIEDANLLREARQVLALLGGSLAFRFFMRIHLVVLKSHVRYDLIVVSGLAKLLVQTCLIVILLLKGHGLLMLATAQIASDLLDQGLIWLFSRKTIKTTVFAPPSKVLLREVLSYSSTIFLNMVGQFLRSRVDPLVLSWATGVATLPIYNTGMRLLTLFGDLMNALIGGPVLSGFCQVEGSSGLGALRQTFLQAMRFSVPFATTGAVGLFAYGPSFLERWMGPDFAESGTVLRLLIWPFALSLMQMPATSMLLALNRHQMVMKATLMAGAFNLFASIALAWNVGFYGVVIATMIEMSLFYGILVPLLAARALAIPIRHYYISAILRPVYSLALPLVCYLIATQGWVKPNYLNLMILSAGMTAISLALFWALVLADHEKASVLRKVSPQNRQN